MTKEGEWEVDKETWLLGMTVTSVPVVLLSRGLTWTRVRGTWLSFTLLSANSFWNRQEH